jgi:hypothetical protein
MASNVRDREFPLAKRVAALEVSLRAGDFSHAAEAAEELRRLGVRVSIPGLGTIHVEDDDVEGVRHE